MTDDIARCIKCSKPMPDGQRQTGGVLWWHYECRTENNPKPIPADIPRIGDPLRDSKLDWLRSRK